MDLGDRPTTVAASKIPVEPILELLGSSSKRIMVHHSSVHRHHPSVLCHSAVLHQSSVLLHLLATVLWNVIIFCFWEVFWTVVAVQWPSRRLHHMSLFFPPRNGTEHGSQSSLTTRDRELVSVLEFRIKPGDLNLRPLTQQSVILPTIPWTGCWNATLQFYNINNLATNVNMPCQIINCIVEI